MENIILCITDHQKDGYEEYDSNAFKSCRKNLDLLVKFIYKTTKNIPINGDLLTVYADNDIEHDGDALFYTISQREFSKHPDTGKLIVTFWVDDYS